MGEWALSLSQTGRERPGRMTAPMLLVPRLRLGPLDPLHGLQAMHDEVPDRVGLRDPQAGRCGPQALDVAADPAAEFRVAPEGQGSRDSGRLRRGRSARHFSPPLTARVLAPQADGQALRGSGARLALAAEGLTQGTILIRGRESVARPPLSV